MNDYIKNLLEETLEETNAKTIEELARSISYGRVMYEMVCSSQGKHYISWLNLR